MNFLLNKIASSAMPARRFVSGFKPSNSSFLSSTSSFSSSQENSLTLATQMPKFENKSGRNFAGYALSVMFPAILIAIEEERRQRSQQVECFWNKSNLQRNKINGRIAASEYNANDPIEDRYHCKQLKNFDAYVCVVFDGHGGWTLSEYAKNLFINELDFQFEQLAKKKFETEDARIIEALNRSFEYIEKSFYEIAVSGKIQKPFNTGSCALVTLVKDNKVYTANIGDCKGVLISEGASANEMKARKINHKLNANSKKEQARLKAEFPNDPDIVICKRGIEGACYVKGRLMPTRAFGDFHLKHESHFRGKGKFNGPYITAKPEIIINELKKEDRYIVMASDGLWDEMNKDKIAQVVAENNKDKSKIVSELINTALVKAAADRKITLKELYDIPPGDRRKVHDDITVVCIDLQSQFKK